MIDFRSVREPRSSSFDFIQIRIASPEEIRGPKDPKERERLEMQGLRNWWSWGEVTKPETINYRSFKPEKDGLFCERIFGPVKDWECHCGKYKRIRYRGVICDRCGVEVTLSRVRRERMGHIELAVPVAHIWFFKTLPSPMGNLLDITLRDLEKIIYYSNYVVIEPGQQDVVPNQLLDEDEYLTLRDKARQEGDDAFRADIGAPAVRELLRRLDVDKISDELRSAVAVESSQHRKKQQLKRLKIIDAFRNSGDAGGTRNKAEWMIMDVIPVIPPDLRPLVPLDGWPWRSYRRDASAASGGGGCTLIASFAGGSTGRRGSSFFGGGGTCNGGGAAVAGARARKRTCNISSACGCVTGVPGGRIAYQIATTNTPCNNAASAIARRCCQRSFPVGVDPCADRCPTGDGWR